MVVSALNLIDKSFWLSMVVVLVPIGINMVE